MNENPLCVNALTVMIACNLGVLYYIHFHAQLCTLSLPLWAFLLGVASCMHISVGKHPLTHCHIAFMSAGKQPLPQSDNGK